MDETVVWRAYPAWSQFTWLYFFGLMAAVRGLLFLKFDVAGWEVWAGGGAALLVCAAILRGWARYTLTSKRVVLTNGYTGREIQALALDSVGEVTVQQGPIARLFGIGTVVIRTLGGEAGTRCSSRCNGCSACAGSKIRTSSRAGFRRSDPPQARRIVILPGRERAARPRGDVPERPR